MAKPIVSVLICSYNAQNFIESTIKSILGQRFGFFELLILDNASNDNTVHVINKLANIDNRIKLYALDKNVGAYPGLNYLLEKAKGKYIAINDHDDIWHKDKLKAQIEFLEKHDEYVGTGSAIVNWYEKYDKFILRNQPETAKVAWHTSLVFRNKGFRYDTSVPVATDFHFIKNVLCKDGKNIHNFPDPFVLRRIFAKNSNLSGKWIRPAGLTRILKLDIGLLDKAALLNRYFLPNELVDYAVTHLLAGNNSITERCMSEHAIMRDFLTLDFKR